MKTFKYVNAGRKLDVFIGERNKKPRFFSAINIIDRGVEKRVYLFQITTGLGLSFRSIAGPENKV